MKREKGSITLFVAVTMIVIVCLIVVIYSKIAQQKNNQLQEIEQIQDEYQSENIEQEYKKTVNTENTNQQNIK